jgi:hypothetical protein
MTDLAWAEIASRFAAARNWWIATSGIAGPHSVPVWGVVIDDVLYFYGQPTAVRSKNLAADPRLVAHLESGESVLIVHGEAHISDVSLDNAAIVSAYASKYVKVDDAEYLPGQPSMAGTQLYEIRPAKAISWEVVSSDNWVNRHWRVGTS